MKMLRVFFDTSALIAAAGSETGASFYLIQNSKRLKIIPISSYYCLSELDRNIDKLSGARSRWEHQLQARIDFVVDISAHQLKLSSLRAKDVPVLAAAVAEHCNFLLTLDRKDFGHLLGSKIQSVEILTPGDFLKNIRD